MRMTSWPSMLGGWFAALGAVALFFPLAALGLGYAPAARERVDDPTLALPLVAALFLAYLVGGYVAGRMAGYRTSWHGLMSAFWGLLVALVVAVIAGGTGGNFGALGTLPRMDLDVASFQNAFTFGAIMAFLAAILGGWLGGVIAPSHPVETRAMERTAERPAATTREPSLAERIRRRIRRAA